MRSVRRDVSFSVLGGCVFRQLVSGLFVAAAGSLPKALWHRRLQKTFYPRPRRTCCSSAAGLHSQVKRNVRSAGTRHSSRVRRQTALSTVAAQSKSLFLLKVNLELDLHPSSSSRLGFGCLAT